MKLLKDIKTSLFLATKQTKKANTWVNFLIVFIMTITFLNLVFVSGILNGLVAGASNDLKAHYSGELIITPKDNKEKITQTLTLLDHLKQSEKIKSITIRKTTGVEVKAEDQKTKPNTTTNEIRATLAGIDFKNEKNVSQLNNFLIEGSYPAEKTKNKILIGSGYLSQYESAIAESSLEGVSVGDKVQINYRNKSKKYIIGGILKAKFNEINSRIFIDSREFQTLTGESRHLSNEIAITVKNSDNQNLASIKEEFAPLVNSSDAKIETWQESQGEFFKDLATTFQVLGGFIGGIGIAVASITLFIVIFINAIVRERYIGIMKAIGIKSRIIKISYILQSIFYAAIGSFVGFLILWFILIPYFQKNPIDFPFSNGILQVTINGIIIRVLILMISSVLAGFIPANIITKKNTIDSLLGR